MQRCSFKLKPVTMYKDCGCTFSLQCLGAKTIQDHLRHLLRNCLMLRNFHMGIPFIYDRYFTISLQCQTRSQSGQGPIIVFGDTTLINQFHKTFLKNDKNKEMLNHYLTNKFLMYHKDDTSLTVTKRDLVLWEWCCNWKRPTHHIQHCKRDWSENSPHRFNKSGVQLAILQLEWLILMPLHHLLPISNWQKTLRILFLHVCFRFIQHILWNQQDGGTPHETEVSYCTTSHQISHSFLLSTMILLKT